ncbi:hypothetical protein B0H13DRAFT_1850931 [Mycena leptocephala]|nr:hypothetical protein B0H13DRAFT_1850931 [Mycena leptocephala]
MSSTVSKSTNKTARIKAPKLRWLQAPVMAYTDPPRPRPTYTNLARARQISTDHALLLGPYTQAESRKGRNAVSGGKPLLPKSALIDDEAVEASGEEEDQDEYEASFIDDGDGDPEPLHWSRTQSPEAGSPNETKTAPVAESTPNRTRATRGSTPALTTRSRSRINRSNNSDDTMDNTDKSPGGHLNTVGHSQSRSAKAKGKGSSSIERPAGKVLEQTQLVVSSATTDQTKTSVSGVSKAYRQTSEIRLSRIQGYVSPENREAWSGRNRAPKRRVGLNSIGMLPPSLTRSRPAQLNDLPDEEAFNTPVVAKQAASKGKGKVKASNAETVPEDIEAAFNANVETPPKKKAKGTTAVTSDSKRVVLHTENIKTVKKLPAKCGVFDKSIQDPLLMKVYSTLPNIPAKTPRRESSVQEERRQSPQGTPLCSPSSLKLVGHSGSEEKTQPENFLADGEVELGNPGLPFYRKYVSLPDVVDSPSPSEQDVLMELEEHLVSQVIEEGPSKWPKDTNGRCQGQIIWKPGPASMMDGPHCAKEDVIPPGHAFDFTFIPEEFGEASPPINEEWKDRPDRPMSDDNDCDPIGPNPGSVGGAEPTASSVAILTVRRSKQAKSSASRARH